MSQQSRAVSARKSWHVRPFSAASFGWTSALAHGRNHAITPKTRAWDQTVSQGGARPLTGVGVLLEHKGLKRVGTVLGKSLLVGILVVQTHLQSKGRGKRAVPHRYGR